MDTPVIAHLKFHTYFKKMFLGSDTASACPAKLNGQNLIDSSPSRKTILAMAPAPAICSTAK